MTDKQFNKIIKMVRMIVDKCDDIEEAKKRLAELDDEEPDKNRAQADLEE